MQDFYDWRDHVPNTRTIVASYLFYLLSLGVICAVAIL